ncbi:MAG: hypothetical protein K2W95_00870 [Candidatus Obscuribacterales bacterium]|nr:hypothetical protein [Candidatus Obscuribacterales bacterium]
MDPAGRTQYEDDFYAQYIAPAVAQAQANAYTDGQSRGSYGGAMVGQLQAQGQLSKRQSGLDYANNLFQNQLAGRQSYFAGGPGIAQQQNQLDVNRGLGVAQMQQNNANAQNQYNLGANQDQNQFAMGLYPSTLDLYKFQQGQKAQKAYTLGSSATGLLGSFAGTALGGRLGGAIGGGIGSLFGGGNKQQVPSYFGSGYGGSFPQISSSMTGSRLF